MRILLIILISIMFLKTMNAQEVKLSEKDKNIMLENLGKLISDNYIFPDVGLKMKEFLQEAIKNKTYNDIGNVKDFSLKVKQDLFQICNDKHLQIKFSPDEASLFSNENPENMNPELDRQYQEEMKFINYGIEKIERLKGNIGYIDIRMFPDVKIAKEKYTAAIKLLEDTDALIIDLRKHSGGDPALVQYLCSYFFDSEPFLLNSIYNRPKNSTEEFYTLKDIPGKKLPNLKLFILTSKFTFSGAEEFAYNLKNLKRAVIIGETTGGGANPVTPFNVDNKFFVMIPTGKAINPITKTNWEGVGVEPDISISANKSFDFAYLEALKSLSNQNSNLNNKFPYDWLVEELESRVQGYIPEQSLLQEYTGRYGERIITFENGVLFHERPGVSPKLRLTPMKKDLFSVESIDYFRIKFNRDSNGNIIELIGLYDNGMADKSSKQ